VLYFVPFGKALRILSNSIYKKVVLKLIVKVVIEVHLISQKYCVREVGKAVVNHVGKIGLFIQIIPNQILVAVDSTDKLEWIHLTSSR
jgi:hypothetical protein